MPLRRSVETETEPEPDRAGEPALEPEPEAGCSSETELDLDLFVGVIGGLRTAFSGIVFSVVIDLVFDFVDANEQVAEEGGAIAGNLL